MRLRAPRSWKGNNPAYQDVQHLGELCSDPAVTPESPVSDVLMVLSHALLVCPILLGGSWYLQLLRKNSALNVVNLRIVQLLVGLF